MTLTVVRSLSDVRAPSSIEELADLEQELIDQFLLAGVGAGLGDKSLAADRSALFEFIRFTGRPVWTAEECDADRFLAYLRRERQQARSTVYGKANCIARFYDFLIARYQGEIHARTGYVLSQPIDEFNKPTHAEYGVGRVPPSEQEVIALFDAWRHQLPSARKYLSAARNYMAASLWRRAGLRINETVMLDIRDWRPDLGEFGKLHIRHGKGSQGRGPKARLVPGIDQVDALMDWWLAEVRPQFGPDYADPDAPMFPSERRACDGQRARVGANALRTALAHEVERWLPDWAGRLTPHGLRHFCASSLYGRGLDLKAIQDLLGHEWLSTTTRYIHVCDEHIELAWTSANARVAARLGQEIG
ncbi:tyrosine-type recombinase/integrase [Streptomyces cylindrosporus]|uniref:Tyrosine-type recombinase/integrase n=1 Tax=Streptomyces cylindrosporus TaxID=2927583 RepID=A0ABS9Y9S5_9ACTN|nr:tyrosine-type recombinase/integrase [Streptomyces cylindrosporus]MCI3273371.1 tyrosine-type recombinase/integrase [Streptomyces cylindrosporus]